MTPYLVTPPASLPVTVAEAKEHAQIEHDDHDAVLTGMITAATAQLDALTGTLGRAIMPQTWAIDVDAAGDYVLPMPDVTEASIDGAPLTITRTPLGPQVTTEAAGTITFTCALPAHLLPSAQEAIKWMVRRSIDQLRGDDLSAATYIIESHIGHLRVPRL